MVQPKQRNLYSKDTYFLTYIEQRLGLDFHNVTSLDLALDTPFSVSPLVKAYLHNKNVTTILNGKRIKDRDEDRPETHTPLVVASTSKTSIRR